MIVRIVLLLVCAASLMTTGCSSHRACGKNNWTITVGAGGGITGGSSGYVMECEGKVSSWRILQPAKDKEMTSLFELGCDSTSFYKTYLDLIHFDTISYSATGNWTYFVELHEGERTHRVNWSGETGPAQVKNFYDLFVGFVTSRGKH